MASSLARTLIPKSAAASIRSIFFSTRSLVSSSPTSIVTNNPSSRIVGDLFRMFPSSYFSTTSTTFCSFPPTRDWVWKQAWEDACKKMEFEGDEETISYKHWAVHIKKPFMEGMTREEIIESYLNTLASVLGSKEEARKKMYSVYAQNFFFFVCNVSEEVARKLMELPTVHLAEPLRNYYLKMVDYTGEPLINGQVVPYDPIFYEEMMKDSFRDSIYVRKDYVRKDAPLGHKFARNMRKAPSRNV